MSTLKSAKLKASSKSKGTKKLARRLQKPGSRKGLSVTTVAKGASLKPRTLPRRKGMEREGGPRQWLYPDLESAYTKLVPREEAAAGEKIAVRKAAKPPGGARVSFKSRLQPGRGEEVLADTPH